MPGWAGVSAAMFAVGWGGNQFTPLLVMYEQHKGFTPLTTSTLLFAYVIGMVPGLLASGALSEKLGRRRLVIPGVVVSILGSLLLAIAVDLPALLFLGRTMSGIGLGIGMVVGGIWIKELSNVPYTDRSAPGAGARRAAMSLTAGFGVGAALAGAVAQWLPAPTSLAFLLHAAISLPALWMLRRAPETVGAKAPPAAVEVGARIDTGVRPRMPAGYFLRVLPSAPWVIAALGISYAVLPGLMKDQAWGVPTAFSALLCLLSLGSGFVAQRVATRLSAVRRRPTTAVGFGVFLAGVLLACAAAQLLNAGLIMLVAVVLGTGYGLMLVGSLEDIERTAPPGRLAGMTAVFYSLAYTGFGVPAVLAWIRQTFHFGYPEMLLAVGAAATVLVSLSWIISRLLGRRSSGSGDTSPAPTAAAAVP
jgi:predicted MFS family arabinose efflux permease